MASVIQNETEIQNVENHAIASPYLQWCNFLMPSKILKHFVEERIPNQITLLKVVL